VKLHKKRPLHSASSRVIIGLTGLTGVGKTEVLKIFKSLGAQTYNLDEISRELVHEDKDLLKKLFNEFGESILNNDGTLNRANLARIVFTDKAQLNKLNAIMFPRLREALLERLEQSSARINVVEAAILFEAGLDKYMDRIITVKCDKKKRDMRNLKRGFENREKFQLSQKEKVEKADFVITNNSSIADLQKHVKKIWKLLNK